MLGGYERAAERLSLGLVARGHRVVVVSERRDRAWPWRERIGALEIERVFSVPRAGIHTVTSCAAYALHLLRHVRAFDVVHVHQYSWPAAIAIAIGRLTGTPVVLKLTNTGPQGIDAALPRGVFGRFSRSQHRRASACVVTSERAAAEATAFGIPAERVHRIPNPLDTNQFQPPAASKRSERRSALGVADAFLVICVANLRAEKNHSMLIEAWERFCAARPKARVQLAILGSGPQADAVDARVRRSPAASSIRLLGRVEDVLSWYEAADLLVISSDAEGLSNSLMEALAVGVPMLSTRVSGSEDVAAEADVGQIVPIGDAGAMAEALALAYESPEQRAQWGRSARVYAVAHYSADAVVEETERLYAALCPGRG